MNKRNVVLLIVSSFILSSCFAQLGYSVDALPSNIGGSSELKRIFRQELMYPSQSLKKKEAGKVVIDFIILMDSTVSAVHIKKSVSPGIDAEALRLFKLIQWYPAVKDRAPISGSWSTSFEFDPQKYAKICKERGYDRFPYLSKADTSGTIEKYPEQLPMYPQGNFALKDFIKENLEYPRQAQLGNLQGKVVLRFIVEPSGLMTNIGVKEYVGGGCEEEAIRILQLIKWYPAKKNGQLVRVKMTYPFYFVLNDEFKDNSAGEQK
jgi:TonB family protein